MGQFLLVAAVALTVGAIVFGIAVLVSGDDRGLDPVEPDGRAVPLPPDRPLEEDDLTQLRFDTVLRGYRMAQVDTALRRAAYDIGYKEELIGVLQAEVDALRQGRLPDAEALRRAREAALPPAGHSPATDAPTTDALTTDALTTDPPTTDPPTADPLTTDPPGAADSASAADPSVEGPAPDDSAVADPAPDGPAEHEPPAEQPAGDARAPAEEPAAEPAADPGEPSQPEEPGQPATSSDGASTPGPR